VPGTGKGADHAAGYKNLVWHPDLAGPYLFEAPSLHGLLPFMEIQGRLLPVRPDRTKLRRHLPGSGQPPPQAARAARRGPPGASRPVHRADRAADSSAALGCAE
jgi:hypothetical protein